MRCKILVGNAMQQVSLEDQLNDFLATRTCKVEDIKIVQALQSIYAFIFYTENS